MLQNEFKKLLTFKFVVTVFWAGCFLSITYAYQINKETQECGCRRIDKNEDSAYIEFDRVEEIKKDKKAMKLVWLRLRNNTTCEIELLSSGGSPLQIADGKLTTDVEEGAPVSVHYEVETDKGRKPAYYKDNFFVFRIRPGYSFTFSIPEDHIKTSYEIIVPFRYVWEEKGDIIIQYPVELKVRYRWATQEDLPEYIRKLAKKKKTERIMK